MEGPIVIEAGGDELLDRVGALWEHLRAYHVALDPHWSDGVLNKTFAERRVELVRKGELGLHVLVAVSGSEAIGFGVCTVTAAGGGEIDCLFVEEPWRSRGVGEQLMHCALAWLRGVARTTIAVDVMHANERAVRFYERYGFRPRAIRLLSEVDVE